MTTPATEGRLATVIALRVKPLPRLAFVTLAEAKTGAAAVGKLFINSKGAIACVLDIINVRGKRLALFGCTSPGCSGTHVRETSDWHQVGSCRGCAASTRGSRGPAVPPAPKTPPTAPVALRPVPATKATMARDANVIPMRRAA